jgi:stress-induced morphogen
MPVDARTIESLIKVALPDAEVTVEDPYNDGNHLSARVVSSAFKGLSRPAQHRLVYDAISAEIAGPLHALALKTSAPAD